MPNKPLRLLLTLAVALALPLLTVDSHAANLKGALKYVPRDAVGALTVDVDGLRSSPLFKKGLSAILQNERHLGRKLEALEKSTGFDPVNDVHGLVFSVGPSFPRVDDDFVLVVEAKVNEGRLLEHMKKEGAKIVPKRDALGKYYLLGEKSDGAIAFRGQYAIIGGIAAFREAMKKQGPSPKLTSRLAPHLKKHVGVALELTPEMKKELGKERKELSQMQTFSGSLHLKGGLELTTTSAFATAGPPTAIARELNQALSAMKSDKSMQRMGLDKYADRIRVRNSRNELEVDLTLSKSELAKLLQLFESFL